MVDILSSILFLILIAIATFLLATRFQHTRKRYPPYSPAKIWTNLRRDGYQRVLHLYEQSLWITSHSSQSKGHFMTGCVYRLHLPLWYEMIVCCDYKLAKLLLHGNEEIGIQESEKTNLIQVLNIFPNVCNLLT